MNIITDNLAKSIEERISEPIKKILNRNNYVFDCHIHIFDRKCINEAYLLTRLALEKIFPDIKLFSSFDAILADDETYPQEDDECIYNMMRENKKLSSWSEINQALIAQGNEDGPARIADNTLWSRHLFLARIIRKRKMKTIYKLFKKKAALTTLSKFKGKDLITCVLQMDLGKTWNGEVTKKPSEQINELRALTKEEPILPFFAIDPRRADDPGKENLYRLFEQAFASGKGAFFGVKVYPSLGFLPSDYRLDEIFALCEQYQIPVVTHCGGEIISTFRNRITVYDGFNEIVMEESSRSNLAFKLNAPEHWEKVLKKYPMLKLNLAHFGNWGSSSLSKPKYIERIETIKKLILNQNYPNVYADYSYSLIHETAFEKFNHELRNETILNHTLFGTDFWVVLFKENIQKAQKEFFENITENTTTQITRSNPDKFLFNKDINLIV